MKKKQNKPIIFTIDSGTYPVDVVVALNATTKQIIAYILKKHKYTLDKDELDGISNVPCGRFCNFKNNAAIIIVPDFDGDPSSMSSLIHEIFHCVRWLLEFVDTPLNDSTDEIYAYQMQFYVHAILAKILAKK